jgi:antibiotic biosynthesis monooxygenase (ABM) superfamily enzyme
MFEDRGSKRQPRKLSTQALATMSARHPWRTIGAWVAAVFAAVVAIGAPLIGSLPIVPRLAVTTLVTVSLMTWAVMPRVTRLMRRWLYPGRAAMTRPIRDQGGFHAR